MTVIEHLAAARHQAFLTISRRRTGAHRLAALGRDSVIVPPATILAPHRIVIGDRVLVFEHATFSLVEEWRTLFSFLASISIGRERTESFVLP